MCYIKFLPRKAVRKLSNLFSHSLSVCHSRSEEDYSIVGATARLELSITRTVSANHNLTS